MDIIQKPLISRHIKYVIGNNIIPIYLLSTRYCHYTYIGTRILHKDKFPILRKSFLHWDKFPILEQVFYIGTSFLHFGTSFLHCMGQVFYIETSFFHWDKFPILGQVSYIGTRFLN